MKCCVNCFKDSDIRKIIELYGEKGDCDFCSSKNTLVYDISKPSKPNFRKNYKFSTNIFCFGFCRCKTIKIIASR